MKDSDMTTTWISQQMHNEKVSQAFERGMEANMNTLTDYKRQIAEGIIGLVTDGFLEQDGAEEFCKDNDVPLKFEHDVEVTIYFKIKGVHFDSEIESNVDTYARAITELGFMQRNMNYLEIDDENYDVRIS